MHIKAIKLWKNGKLKELNRGMFSSEDDYERAVEFWFSEGWDETYPNNVAED